MTPWTLKRLERAVENFTAQLQCSICLCSYAKPVSLPCNHCFCEECIHRALELKALCPICKAPAKKRQLRYDTTVQEILRATEMLCASPTSGPSTVASQLPSEDEMQGKNQLMQHGIVAQASKVTVTKGAAKTTTPEKKLKPQRCAKRKSQTLPSSQLTLVDKLVDGGTVQLRSGLKIKNETLSMSIETPAKRKLLSQEIDSDIEATQMSPALCEVSMPSSDNGEAKDCTGIKDKLVLCRRRSSACGPAVDIDAPNTPLDVQDRVFPMRSLRRRRPAMDQRTLDADAAQKPPTSAVKEQMRMSSRRRKSYVDEDAVDLVVAETQSEVVEMVQLEAIKRRRRSALDFAQSKGGRETIFQRRRRSDSAAIRMDGITNETQVEAAKAESHTSILRNRRRLGANGGEAGVDSTKKHMPIAKPQPASYGTLAPRHGPAESSLLAITSQEHPLKGVHSFQVGDLVDVMERQWVGINRRGGAARIIKIHGDGSYAVKFVIGSGSDKRVPGSFIQRPGNELVSDSTPSHAVRKRRQSLNPMPSLDLLTAEDKQSSRVLEKKSATTKVVATAKEALLGMVFLCSGFKDDRMERIVEWAKLLEAKVVQHWSNDVTHLIVKCVSKKDTEDDALVDSASSETSPQRHHNGQRILFGDRMYGRWVKIRSLKYLTALVGGRWIVSDEWLQACADHGGYVSEVKYEADGHWRGRRIPDAVKRSRLTREKLLQLSPPNIDRSNIGTMLFANLCFHVTGDFLYPMPPISDLHTLIRVGGGKLIVAIDDIPNEMHKRKNRSRKLIIVSDKINPIALRLLTRQLKTQPLLESVSSVFVLSYLWVINSISDAKLREFP